MKPRNYEIKREPVSLYEKVPTVVLVGFLIILGITLITLAHTGQKKSLLQLENDRLTREINNLQDENRELQYQLDQCEGN